MSTNPQLSEIGRILAEIRWAKTTPEQRKAATEKARSARKAKAAERRAARENGQANGDD